jgi:endonuclease/exonuclease/phosphatase family metal-dependent hydrolase
MDVLSSRGLEYMVAGKVRNSDAEVPMITAQNPSSFDDVRLTDFDVVLAKEDIKISNVLARNYAAGLAVPGPGIEVVRGFVAVDATVRKQTWRFVSTHLEQRSSGKAIQSGQARELMSALADDSHPVILTGDLNTTAPDAETYMSIRSAGFVDTWTINETTDSSNPGGFTSNHDDNLRNEVVDLDTRVDYIMIKTDKQVRVLANVIGDEPNDRTPSGLWPSDHAGIAAKLSLYNN